MDGILVGLDIAVKCGGLSGDAEIAVKLPIGQPNSVAELGFGMFFACLESFVWSMIVIVINRAYLEFNFTD